MGLFVLPFFPLDVLDEIWDVIESVLRDFLPTLPIVAVVCDVYDGVFLCCPFSTRLSWMRS